MIERQPKPGDRVRVTFEGRWTGKSDLVEQDNGRIVDIDVFQEAVEVIEAADDPSKDPVGTVRRRQGFDEIAIQADTDATTYEAWLVLGNPASSGWARHEYVSGWEIIGAVPGTPAAVCPPGVTP